MLPAAQVPESELEEEQAEMQSSLRAELKLRSLRGDPTQKPKKKRRAKKKSTVDDDGDASRPASREKASL